MPAELNHDTGFGSNENYGSLLDLCDQRPCLQASYRGNIRGIGELARTGTTRTNLLRPEDYRVWRAINFSI